MALTKKKDDDLTDDKGEQAKSPESGVEAAGTTDQSPEPPASTLVIRIEDHKLDVDVKDGPGSVDTSDEDSPRSVENLSADELQKLQRALLDENTRRGIGPQTRQFEGVDTESLRVLQNELRGELASR